MTLTGRVSLFFLGALAAVLAGFSAALYALADVYLHRQADERLDAALNTLAAAAELAPDGVEWDPNQRDLSSSRGRPEKGWVWVVLNHRGRPIDRSEGAPASALVDAYPAAALAEGSGRQDAAFAGAPWRLAHRRLRPRGPPAKAAADHPHPPTDADRTYPSLVLLAGVSLEPLRATLHGLAATLLGLSGGLWALAAVGGRWLGRRALRPVRRMAQAPDGPARPGRGDAPSRAPV
jgi:hypothetical protein